MNSTVQIAKRLSEFLSSKGLSMEQQALLIGYENVGSWKNAISTKGVRLVGLLNAVNTYSDLPLDYIIKGKSANFFSKIGELPSKVTECFDSKSKVKVFDEMIDGSEIPTASQDEMKEVSPNDGVPYYDDEFACGIDQCYDDNRYPDYYIRIKGMERATLFCNASGDSMSPLIDKGDVVALQKIEDFSYLPLGEIYALRMSNDVHTIKRLRKGSDKDSYILEPINPEHESEEIPKSLITDVYKVIGCLKKF